MLLRASGRIRTRILHYAFNDRVETGDDTEAFWADFHSNSRVFSSDVLST